MTEPLSLRPYRPGDEAQICGLFADAFQRDLSLDWWRWRYLDNPVDQPRIMLAWDGEQLVSHYAVSPLRLQVGGEERLIALSMGTMTRSAYKGRGLFPALAARLYADLEASGYVGVMGFPNANSHRGFVDNLGWSDVAVQHILGCDLVRPVRDAHERVLFSEEATPAETAALLNTPASSLQLTWDAATVAWRIHRASGNAYRLLRAQDPDGEAVVLWKMYAGTAIDIVAFGYSSPAALTAVVAELCRRAAGLGATRAACWASLHDPAHGLFERLGFTAEGPVTYFGGRIFNSAAPGVDLAALRLAMLTSDVY